VPELVSTHLGDALYSSAHRAGEWLKQFAGFVEIVRQDWSKLISSRNDPRRREMIETLVSSLDLYVVEARLEAESNLAHHCSHWLPNHNAVGMHDHPQFRLQFKKDTLDAKAMQTLANLRPNLQLEALRQFFSIDLGQMKNPSAYLSGITRSINRASDNSSLENFKATRVSEQLDLMYRKYGPRWVCWWEHSPCLVCAL
jgi:hypothetical protein